MDHDEMGSSQGTPTLGRTVCLVQGCSCRDARIVSRRRASFFADLARSKGETARRVIRPEAGWTLPTSA
jgi:hypothetical protein